jgi:hypothetical protein
MSMASMAQQLRPLPGMGEAAMSFRTVVPSGPTFIVAVFLQGRGATCPGVTPLSPQEDPVIWDDFANPYK